VRIGCSSTSVGCVGLCNGIIEDEKVFDFFAADDEDAALAGTRGKPAEELVSEVFEAKSTQNVGALA
jgi:hypothetical protein